MNLSKAERAALRRWHLNQIDVAVGERDFIRAQDHQDREHELKDEEEPTEGSLRELANCLMTIARDHPCASQALGIVSFCADHLRAVACCLDAAKKEA